MEIINLEIKLWISSYTHQIVGKKYQSLKQWNCHACAAALLHAVWGFWVRYNDYFFKIFYLKIIFNINILKLF